MGRPKLPPLPIRIDGSVAYIPLLCGGEAVVDAADVPLVSPHRWTRNGTGYVYRSYRDPTSEGRRGHSVFLHRELMVPGEGFVVDHIDGDQLNCRRLNLRVCSQQQNTWNSRVSSRNLLGIKGVSQDGTRFVAKITVSGKGIHLGRFSTAGEASAAYREAAERYFGEYARTA